MSAFVRDDQDSQRTLRDAVLASGKSYGEISDLTGLAKSVIQRYCTGATRKIPLARYEAIMKVCTTDKKQEEPMKIKELSTEELINSLKYCATVLSCQNCPYSDVIGCNKKLMSDAAERLEHYAYGLAKECRCCDGVAPDHGHDHDVLQMDLSDAIRTIADMGWDLIVNMKISSETLLEVLGDIFDDRA